MLKNLTLAEKIKLIPQIKEALNKKVKGFSKEKEYIIKSFLNWEHILIEWFPWNWKTELVLAFANSIWATVKRIQWANDLMPQDIIWYTWLDWKFQEWPIFTNILIVDEINRISSKSLSWLIQAMAEKQISDDKWNFKQLPEFFMVVATQNPNDNSWIYELPEAIKDRFWIKLFINKEKWVLKDIYLMKNPKEWNISDKILDKIQYIFDELDPNFNDWIVDKDFNDWDLIKNFIDVWPSIRSWLQYIEYIKTNAYINWRDLVIEEDLYKDIESVFRDKIILKPEARSQINIDELLKKFIEIVKK